MKKAIILSLALASTSLAADPKIFGLELGVTTESDFIAQHQATLTGVNKYSRGNMYEVPPQQISFDGLNELTAVFNQDRKLVAVLTKLPKSKFDYLNSLLSSKYKLTNQNIPFVGNKSANYRDGKTAISLDAPHLSFTMEMNYIRDDFKTAYTQQSQREQEQKRRSESSQL